MAYPKPVAVPFYFAALLGAIVAGAVVAYVCHAVFSMAPVTAGVAGLVVGIVDFFIVKALFDHASGKSAADDNRIG